MGKSRETRARQRLRWVAVRRILRGRVLATGDLPDDDLESLGEFHPQPLSSPSTISSRAFPSISLCPLAQVCQSLSLPREARRSRYHDLRHQRDNKGWWDKMRPGTMEAWLSLLPIRKRVTQRNPWTMASPKTR